MSGFRLLSNHCVVVVVVVVSHPCLTSVDDSHDEYSYNY